MELRAARHRLSRKAGGSVVSYRFNFAWSFFNSGLTAWQPSLPQPVVFFFRKVEINKNAAAIATTPSAMMVWMDALTSQ